LAKKEEKQSAWAKEFGIDDVEKYFAPEPVEPPRERTKKANLNATMQIVEQDDEMQALIDDIMNQSNFNLLADETESEQMLLKRSEEH